MILAPHILLGAAIGAKISNPAAIFGISFASHYLLDALPHYEYDNSALKSLSSNKKILIDLLKIAVDFCFGAGLALLLVWNTPARSGAVLGMLAALLPDALLFLYWRHPHSKFLKIFAWPHRACHYLKNLSPGWLSLSTEIFVSFAMIFYLAYAL